MVGAALAPQGACNLPEDRECSLRFELVEARGQGKCRLTECLYKQEKGVFTPPMWPVALALPQRITEEDKAWKEVQHQCRTHGFTISHSLVCLEAVINTALSRAESVDVPVLLEAMVSLQDEISGKVNHWHMHKRSIQ